MALDFPNSPNPNDTYTLGNKQWTWDGTAWNLTSTKIGYTGSEGYTGSKGTDGIVGYDGSVGYTGSMGYSGSVGYAGSRGYTGSIGYNSSIAGYTGSIGAGYTGSTIAFKKTIVIDAPGTTENVTFFYSTDALTLSKVRAVVAGSSPSVTYSVKSGSDRSSSSETNVSGQTVTSTTSGTDATVADSTITAGSWVWLEISATSGTVDSFTVTLEF